MIQSIYISGKKNFNNLNLKNYLLKDVHNKMEPFLNLNEYEAEMNTTYKYAEK